MLFCRLVDERTFILIRRLIISAFDPGAATRKGVPHLAFRSLRVHRMLQCERGIRKIKVAVSSHRCQASCEECWHLDATIDEVSQC